MITITVASVVPIQSSTTFPKKKGKKENGKKMSVEFDPVGMQSFWLSAVFLPDRGSSERRSTIKVYKVQKMIETCLGWPLHLTQL
jgi:hypothetical protein